MVSQQRNSVTLGLGSLQLRDAHHWDYNASHPRLKLIWRHTGDSDLGIAKTRIWEVNILCTAKPQDLDEMIKRRGRKLITALESEGFDTGRVDPFKVGVLCLFGRHECESTARQSLDAFKRVAGQVRGNKSAIMPSNV